MSVLDKIVQKKGWTLIELMVTVATVSSLATLCIPNYLSSKTSANQVRALATLKSYAEACEVFYATTGSFPTDELVLVEATPPYFYRSLDGTSECGYDYTINFAAGGYTLIASAQSQQTGKWNYRVTPGLNLMRQAQEGGHWTAFDP